MNKVIIYKNDDGGVSVCHPSAKRVAEVGLQAIAQKLVPTGKPYKIIDTSELPATREDRGAWTIADNELTDGVGA